MTAQGATRGQSLISATVASRFAPSPTGPLHLGHAYSAIRAHDVARASAGRFIVRIEDIDTGRSRPAFVDAIFDDLRWLGLSWDEVAMQSERQPLYEAAMARLRDMGLAYPCICSRAEIAASASAPQGDRPPAYPGTCRTRRLPADIPAAWRLDMTAAVARTGWDAARPWGDVVIARKDARASYHLAVVVDDADQGVTDIVRGRDLLPATDVHHVLQQLLDLPVPRYHHHPLVTGPDGNRLAKRDGATALAGLREQGVDGRMLADRLRTGFLPIGFAFDTA